MLRRSRKPRKKNWPVFSKPVTPGVPPPDELNELTVSSIEASFVLLLKAWSIVAGRNVRLSTPSVAHAFVEEARISGTDPGV
jgi:hypothetical protein